MSEENKQEPGTTEAKVESNLMPVENKSFGLKSLIIAIIGVVAIGIIAFLQPKPIAGHDGAKYVVVDMAKIMDVAMKQILEDKELKSDQVAAVGTKLGENIKKLLGEYQAQGYLVFNAKSLAAYPPEYDVTAKFSERLGLKEKLE